MPFPPYSEAATHVSMLFHICIIYNQYTDMCDFKFTCTLSYYTYSDTSLFLLKSMPLRASEVGLFLTIEPYCVLAPYLYNRFSTGRYLVHFQCFHYHKQCYKEDACIAS